jgi:hypothetical protein
MCSTVICCRCVRWASYHYVHHLHLSGRPWHGHGQVSNAAAGYLKRRAVAVARTAPRDNGLAPQRLSALFRFRVRCELQAAIMRGNGLIAAEVGL